MSHPDSFIDEVNEEVRRDRLYRGFRRYGWIGALLIVAAVGGASWNEYRKSQARAAAEARGDAILAAASEADPARRAASLAALGDGSENVAVTTLLAAAEEATTGNATAARARLDALAANTEVSQIYRDLAVLKSVMIADDSVPPTDRIARLNPLTLPGAPFRLPALEQLALAHVAGGDTGAALDILRGLVTDASASQGLRRRASQLIVALGGSLDAS